jgi:uncharacterized integral membrane protein
MRIIRWLVGLFVFAGALLFALDNTGLVTVRLYHLFSWQAPLIVLLLLAFALGVGAGVLAGITRIARLRRQVARLRQHPRRDSAPAQAPPAPGV